MDLLFSSHRYTLWHGTKRSLFWRTIDLMRPMNCVHQATISIHLHEGISIYNFGKQVHLNCISISGIILFQNSKIICMIFTNYYMEYTEWILEYLWLLRASERGGEKKNNTEHCLCGRDVGRNTDSGRCTNQENIWKQTPRDRGSEKTRSENETENDENRIIVPAFSVKITIGWLRFCSNTNRHPELR